MQNYGKYTWNIDRFKSVDNGTPTESNTFCIAKLMENKNISTRN